MLVCRTTSRDPCATQFRARSTPAVAAAEDSEDSSIIDLSHLPSSDEEMPALIDPDEKIPHVLERWDRAGHPIRALLESIEIDEHNGVLDPHWCVPNCPYGSDSLECQRYTLLKRLYQIQAVLDKYPKRHRRTPSLDNKLDAYVHSVSRKP